METLVVLLQSGPNSRNKKKGKMLNSYYVRGFYYYVARLSFNQQLL